MSILPPSSEIGTINVEREIRLSGRRTEEFSTSHTLHVDDRVNYKKPACMTAGPKPWT